MHPALSIIIFTATSGAGFGLLVLTGLGFALDWLPRDRWFGLAALGSALVLVSGGLIASLLHLGHPERAWRALSQWRSSWLSREGVVSVAIFVPAGIFGLGWIWFERRGGFVAGAAVVTGLLALLAIVCTAMIYRSLKPVHQWHNDWVVPNYLALGIMSGALWLHMVLAFWPLPRGPLAPFLLAFLVAAAALKLGYWRFIDRTRSPATPESATGLGAIGKVRLLDPPHSGSSFLLDEMGFRVARKHAAKLRRIAVSLAFVLPVALAMASFFLAGAIGAIAAILATVSALSGVLIERWLFFAEARHTVTLYYGADTA